MDSILFKTAVPDVSLSAIILLSQAQTFPIAELQRFTAMPRTIEFETELTGGRTLDVPPEIASALPSQGKATIVVFVDMDPDDAVWQRAAYQQFLSDDSGEDAVYDGYR